MIVITVIQENESVTFRFNETSEAAAIEFMTTALECGDDGTVITIEKREV